MFSYFLLRLISVTVFNFTHPSVLSALLLISETVFSFTHPPVLYALLLILSASRLLAPDSPLLVPAPFLFSAPLHGMAFPFLSDGNPLWTPSTLTRRRFFFSKQQTCHVFRFALLSSSASSKEVNMVLNVHGKHEAY